MVQILSSSFRDPSGQVFWANGEIYRSINPGYRDEFEKLHSSGLYAKLVDQNLLIPHSDASVQMDGAYRVIKPERIQTISYPYEWSFSQFKDAALLTLSLQRIAVEHGMSLKDASAYNVQFHKGRPIFIDTLSFEPYTEGKPWIAYKQFCQHFLAPLCLMYYKDLRLGQLLKTYIDGVPLDLAANLLPRKTKLSLVPLLHIHLHSNYQSKYSQSGISKQKTAPLSKNAHLGIIDQLSSFIAGLSLPKVQTEWGDYYSFTNYNDQAFKDKAEIIEGLTAKLSLKQVWDLGANRGHFSRLFSSKKIPTVAWDIDPLAVEKNYTQVKKDEDDSLLPLVLDLTNPSSAIGWANEERMSFSNRGPVDLVLALALIHHIAISNNVPLEKVAQYFATLSKNLIIEFVPKEDSQVKTLLSSREDIFPEYTIEGFERAFTKYFTIVQSVKIQDSARHLYLMASKSNLH